MACFRSPNWLLHAALIGCLAFQESPAQEPVRPRGPAPAPDGPQLPRSETIAIRDTDKPTLWTVFYDQLAVYIPDFESTPPRPPSLEVNGRQLILEKESANWEDLAIYRVANGPLSAREQLETARALQKQHAWIKTAGAVIRSTGRPYLMLQKLTIEFREGVSEDAATDLHRKLGADKFRINRRNKQLHTVYFSNRPIIELFKVYEARRDLVRWIAPDAIIPLAAIPSSGASTLTPWHHNNPGNGMDVLDADIDSTEAWTITEGANGIVIAVIDGGFERTHQEFTLWENTTEKNGTSNSDDDDNGWDDDIFGYDFENDDPDVNPADGHGTKAAGCAAARGNNAHGIRGTCPNARLMLLQAISFDEIRDAFQYGTCMGADVICLPRAVELRSDLQQAVDEAVGLGRGGRGVVISAALGRATVLVMITDLESVTAVRDSTAQDTLARTHQLGRSLSVLAPGKRIATTTDSTPISPHPAYLGGFGGSSAATPIYGGAAALVLSARADLTWQQVQRLMQDTCDKVDPATANYGESSGYSEPADLSTHGFGRINLWEAVRMVAPAGLGGRNGVDVFLRDQRYDWGNTERPSNVLFDATASVVPHNRSPDIKVDTGPDFYAPPTTSREFDLRPEEAPLSSEPAKIYVRVRNRGLATIAEVRVRVFATTADILPPLPLDGNGETAPMPSPTIGAVWSLVGEAHVDIGYSGSSVANHPTLDGAVIVPLSWTPPASTATLLAVVDCDADPVDISESNVDLAVPRDNNLALRSFAIVATSVRVDRGHATASGPPVGTSPRRCPGRSFRGVQRNQRWFRGLR